MRGSTGWGYSALAIAWLPLTAGAQVLVASATVHIGQPLRLPSVLVALTGFALGLLGASCFLLLDRRHVAGARRTSYLLAVGGIALAGAGFVWVSPQDLRVALDPELVLPPIVLAGVLWYAGARSFRFSRPWHWMASPVALVVATCCFSAAPSWLDLQFRSEYEATLAKLVPFARTVTQAEGCVTAHDDAPAIASSLSISQVCNGPAFVVGNNEYEFLYKPFLTGDGRPVHLDGPWWEEGFGADPAFWSCPNYSG